MNRRIALAIAGAGIAIAGTLALGVQPAFAGNYYETCAQHGTGYCLNDWNGGGLGNAVKMYYTGYANDSIYTGTLTTYCNNGAVSATCPFSDHSLDSQLLGARIVEIYSGVAGNCVGTDYNGDAVITTCPTGGLDGSNVWIEAKDSNCNYSYAQYFENLYWTNTSGGLDSLISGGSIGAQAGITGVYNGSCWGEIYS